ncbi:hypothetical protein FisN_19Lh282 [Fistulifera solaris]|uniref:SWIM-type domain-containing protein n=1 Tax=Fistulifera solaris TaxID=1519565 RepID=A0A1Z5K7J6_FISSO|nr:hypothetical protein FisN_19Lh282 [Fistulifera solaris]|eukprot:GAX22217.1 hypothetical protein FisN_19Lh282 [Fistulifera solaris]
MSSSSSVAALFVFRTLMEQYGLNKEADPFHWEAKCFGLPILKDDLDVLVRSIAFSYEGHLFERTDKSTNYYQYRCIGCCQEVRSNDTEEPERPFSLYFKQRKHDPRYFDICPSKCHFRHNHHNHQPTYIVPEKYKGGMLEIYKNSPILLHYFQQLFQGNEPSKEARSYKTATAFLATTKLAQAAMSSSTYSRLYQYFYQLYQQEQHNYHSLLRPYLLQYIARNRTANVFLQADTEGSIYRMFLSVPEVAQLVETVGVNGLFIDTVTSTKKDYHGTLLYVMALTGQAEWISLAAAWCPQDNAAGLLFIVQMLAASGISFSKTPVYTSRQGAFLSAVTVAQRDFQIEVSLKYTIDLLLTQIIRHFSIDANDPRLPEIQQHIHALQAAPTIASFLVACEKFRNMVPERATPVLKFIMRNIHPRHWTVFGNNAQISDEEWAPDYFYCLGRYMGITDHWTVVQREFLHDPVPLGQKFPLMGFLQSNRAASTAEWFQQQQVRNGAPPDAAHHFLTVSAAAITHYQHQIAVMHSRKIPCTDVAAKLLVEPTRGRESCSVPTAHPPNVPIHITDTTQGFQRMNIVRHNTTDTTRTYTCTCYLFSNYGVPCCHILAVRKAQKKSDHDVPKLLPKWGSVEAITNYLTRGRPSHQPYAMKLSCWSDIRVKTDDDVLKPAPVYILNPPTENLTDSLSSSSRKLPSSAQPPKTKKARTTQTSETNSDEVPNNSEREQRSFDDIVGGRVLVAHVAVPDILMRHGIQWKVDENAGGEFSRRADESPSPPPQQVKSKKKGVETEDVTARKSEAVWFLEEMVHREVVISHTNTRQIDSATHQAVLRTTRQEEAPDDSLARALSFSQRLVDIGVEQSELDDAAVAREADLSSKDGGSLTVETREVVDMMI